jgi:hypothetical protein
MTDADLKCIEDAIGRPLSAAVRRFFLNYPEGLRTTKREMFVSGQDAPVHTECPAEYELCGDAEGIIEMNAVGGGGLVYGDWPANQLVLGAGACGETYWVDLDSESGAVYRFEAGQQDDSDDIADSLEQFARNLIASYREE